MTPELINGNTYIVVVEPTSNPSVVVDFGREGPQGPAGANGAPGANGAGVPSDGIAGQILTSNGGSNTYWSNANYVTSAQLTNNLSSYITTNDFNITIANYVTNTNLTNNLANYQTTAGLAANVAKLAANSATFILANNGIISNSSGVFVNGNTGIVVNTAGVFVNSSLYVNNSNLSANLANYTLSGGSPTFSNVTVSNSLLVVQGTAVGQIQEAVLTYTNANGVYTFDCANASIFNMTTPAAAFTPKLTNLLLNNNYVTAVTFFVNQGATPYMLTSNVQINTTTNTSINWQGGLTPAGTANKKDVITLSIFNVNNAYTVIGQLTSFG